jgi:DNA repair protein RecN (Recombination protein N)
VLRSREELRRELAGIEHADERIAEIQGELTVAQEAYARAAATLSQLRKRAAADFSQQLERSLADLAMARTRCEVRFEPDRGEDGWSERGSDVAEFYISPNPGEDLRPLARVASGGELSRIMLALKTLASTDEPGKTLIFDEVDAGIGGTVADIVGARLRALGGHFQVLCITHLPQIAAYGSTHYGIVKAVRNGRTQTEVTRLSPREREAELARMIAGAEVSASVRASAREMLKRKAATE